MSRRRIPESLQKTVRLNANHLCEYCHASEKWQYIRFTIDHVVPVDQGGKNDLENLALACFHCNRRKWNQRGRASLDSRRQEEQLLLRLLSIVSELLIFVEQIDKSVVILLTMIQFLKAKGSG